MEAEGYRYVIRLKANAVLERHIALETTEFHLSDLFRDRHKTGSAPPRCPHWGVSEDEELRASVGSTEASNGRLARVGRIDRRVFQHLH